MDTDGHRFGKGRKMGQKELTAENTESAKKRFQILWQWPKIRSAAL
jgi:hypothetical protein